MFIKGISSTINIYLKNLFLQGTNFELIVFMAIILLESLDYDSLVFVMNALKIVKIQREINFVLKYL